MTTSVNLALVWSNSTAGAVVCGCVGHVCADVWKTHVIWRVRPCVWSATCYGLAMYSNSVYLL